MVFWNEVIRYWLNTYGIMCARTKLGKWIPYTIYVYNTTVHTNTVFMPFELVYGFKSEVPLAFREAPIVQYN